MPLTIEVEQYGDGGFIAQIPGTRRRGVGNTVPMALRKLGESIVELKERLDGNTVVYRHSALYHDMVALQQGRLPGGNLCERGTA